MGDLSLIAIVGYVQLGLFALGYLFYRRLGELRSQVLVHEACSESMGRRFEAVLRELEARLMRVDSRSGQRGSKESARSRRRRALAMIREGRAAATVAEALRLRGPELNLVVQLDKLRRHAAAAPS